MNCLIIGFGSIGKRHAHVLKSLGCEITVVTSQKITDFLCFSSIKQALANKFFDYVVIANPTYLHFTTLLDLISCEYDGIVLVEKPLFSNVEELPPNKIKKILVAYNLRFHDLLLETKKLIAGQDLITFSAYVGQYLPTWRKHIDYRTSYSASKERGGGVLRDLSHELDYATWLCGPCIQVTALGGKMSDLEITSDDVYSIIMKCDTCPIVNLQLNYLDKCTRRELTINTSRTTFFVDFVQGTLSVDGEIMFQCLDGTSKSYYNQHRALLNQDFTNFCNYADGLSITKLIEFIETASLSRTWIIL